MSDSNPAGAMALFISILAVVPVGAAGETGDSGTLYGTTELLRDAWGTPHVFSTTDAGAFYGLGYAMAEDRAFHMYYSLRLIQGRASELVGEVKKLEGRETSIQYDRKLRTIDYPRAAREVVSNLDEESRSLLEAFSRGVNDYVTSHRSGLLYLFEQLELEPEPWTPAATVLSWWHAAQFFAKDGLRDLFSYYQDRAVQEGTAPTGTPRLDGPLIVDDAAAVVQRGDIDAAWVGQVQQYVREHRLEFRPTQPAETPQFSHAWVVGGDRTTTHRSVLVSDPQTPVRNPSLMYEFHLQGATFNARGIGVPGSPVILIGFNEDLAWGMTALGADQSDLFRLETDPAHPDQYFFDGRWRALEVHRETIRVRGGADQQLTVRRSHLGPLVTEFALGAQPGDQVALKRIPLAETNRDTIQGSLAMMRASNVQEFLEALEGWRFPSAHAIFGDRRGQIGYTTVGAIPVRSWRDRRAGNVAHDGTSSDWDWQGILPHRLHPHTLNPDRGYILSGNHRPIASFYPLGLIGLNGGAGDSSRSRRIRERLQGKSVFTPEEVLDVQYDCVSPAKRDIVQLGFHLRDRGVPLSAQALSALHYLEEWNRRGARSDTFIPGTELVHLMPLRFRGAVTELTSAFGGGDAGLNYFLKSLKARLAADPESPLKTAEQAFIDNTLASSWQSALRAYGPRDWHAESIRQLGESRLGYFVSLDGFPSLDPARDLNMPLLRCTEKMSIQSQVGQSYTQWVPTGSPDGARSVLPIGPSEHPNSPGRTSMYGDWVTGSLRPAPLRREAVERILVSALRLTTTGERLESVEP